MTAVDGGSMARYTYDTLNRLATASTTQAGNPYPNYCWAYDSFGNRLNQLSSSVAFPTGSGGAGACMLPGGATIGQSDWAQYNGTVNGSNNNQMSATDQNLNQGQGYDQAGNVTNDGVNTYLYDAEGRICAVESTPVAGMTTMTGYVYDAEGNRVAKGTITSMSCNPAVNGLGTAGDETDYVIGANGEPVTELAEDSNGTMNWQRTYVYAGGALVATYDPAQDSSNPPQLSFRLTDWLGTLRETTDASGVAQGTCTGLPFGDGMSCNGAMPDNHHFTGKERDAESGNDYFGARYYASSMGRWLSPDWSAQVEPVPYAKMGDPQSLNLYSYVGNNPLVGEDPDGHASQCSLDGVAVTCSTLAGAAPSDAFKQCPPEGCDRHLPQDQGQGPDNKAQQQQLRDVSPAEGQQILKSAEGMEGTPYKYGGNSKQGIDCIHMVCSALNKAGVDARTNANANNFQKDVHMRPLGPKEQPRTGDIVQWKHQPTGHVGVYDANPSKAGYNIYSATNHGVMHAPASWFSSLGTPTYYRVEVPQ